MIMYHLGPQLGVWIMQVSTFSSVLINRFHCITNSNPHTNDTIICGVVTLWRDLLVLALFCLVDVSLHL